MKKFLSTIIIVLSLCFAVNFAIQARAQDATSQNDMLQQYLQSKQQQAQKAQLQQTQQTQNANATAQSKSGLSKWEKVLLAVYSVTLLLAWTNLILGIFALTRWIKQKKSPAEINKKMIG